MKITDDGHSERSGFFVNLPSQILRDSFGDNGDSSDLRERHRLDGRLVSGPQGGEIDQHIRLGMLFHAIGHVLVYWDQDFLHRERDKKG